MSSTVWAAPAMRLREANILRFLKDARCSVRLVEVSLFKEFIFDRVARDAGSLTATCQGPPRRSRSTSLMAGPWKSGLWPLMKSNRSRRARQEIRHGGKS
jgi:hypothetical protein